MELESLLSSDDQLIPFCNFSAISEHRSDHASLVWWSNSVFLPSIAIVGIFFNLLNIAILTTNRAARRMPSWSLLVSLALCDSLFLLFALLETTPLSVSAVAASPLLNRLYLHSALYIRTAASTFYKSSVLIVVAFNIERYVYVVWPLRSQRICTDRLSRIAVAACIGVSLASSLQWPLCYEVTACQEPSTNQSMHFILLKQSAAAQAYYRAMDFLALFGFNILPICMLLFLNTRLILTLKRVAADDLQRKQGMLHQDNHSSPEHSTQTSRRTANAMLFAVVGVLLVCLGPQAPARLLFSRLGQYHPTAVVYACITQQLVFLNASLNFALYCVVSRRYRTLMRSTVHRLLSSVGCFCLFLSPSSLNPRCSKQPLTSLYEPAGIPLISTSTSSRPSTSSHHIQHSTNCT